MSKKPKFLMQTGKRFLMLVAVCAVGYAAMPEGKVDEFRGLVDKTIGPSMERLSEDLEKFREVNAQIRTLKESGQQLSGDIGPAHAYFGFPVDVGYPGNLLVLENDGYVVGYCEERNNPAWVAYRVFDDPTFGSGERPSGFRMDARTQSRVSHDDYTHSGYDRGHMAPNYAIATRYGVEAQEETFLMSNIVPQSPSLNRGIWRELESLVADWSHQHEDIWVVTGPIYDQTAEYLDSGVEVPDAFYKILMDVTERNQIRTLAFVLPQSGGDSLREFSVSVDKVEAWTGLDFFPELPEDAEVVVEAQMPKGLW
jgi:endonuclease G